MANPEKAKKSKEAVVKDFIIAAERAGVPGFVLGLEDAGLVTTHLQNMPMNGVSRIVIALFSQMCDFEAAQGHMSPEYRATMKEMKDEFLKMIKTYNARFDALRNGPKTKTS